MYRKACREKSVFLSVDERKAALANGFSKSRGALFLATSVALGSVVLARAGFDKGADYFASRLGASRSSETVTEMVVNLPFNPMIYELSSPCVAERYQKGDLITDVLYAQASGDAIWVSLTLTIGWTQESMVDALSAYGSGWKRVETPWTDGLRLPLYATQGVYRSEEGGYAWHLPESNQVVLFSRELIESYRKVSDQALTTVDGSTNSGIRF